jgi:hypothetical protein
MKSSFEVGKVPLPPSGSEDKVGVAERSRYQPQKAFLIPRLKSRNFKGNFFQEFATARGGSLPARRTWGLEIGLTTADGAEPIVEMLWNSSATVEGSVETPWRTIWQNTQRPESPAGKPELPGIDETARDDCRGTAISGW